MRLFCRYILLFFLLGVLTLPAMAADGEASSGQSLRGKTMLVIGDSYSASHNLPSKDLGWPSLVADDYGMELYDYAISGSSFGTGPKAKAPMVERCREITEPHADIIIIQGGSNDWSKGIPVGERDDRVPDTMLGALNLMLDYFEETYPEATIVCFTPWVSTGTANELGWETTRYTEAMLMLCQYRGILCYDASNTVQNDIYMNTEAFRTKYCLTPTDRWHLNAGGQTLIAKAFSRWLEENLCSVTVADRFSDMASAEYSLKVDVSRVYENGIMYGTSDSLFSPTLAASRSTLAVTLYRIAQWPSVTPKVFGDVPTDHQAYYAICWAVEQGILTAEDGMFYPDRALRREELVKALKTCLDLWGGEISQLQGLGQYSDKDSVEKDLVIPWGWALKTGALSPLGDRLAPEAIVSRGQLATALVRLLEEF